MVFAGKAAPSYTRAKLIIKLINSVARVVNHDPRINGRLKVVFLPNYNVSLAEKIIPAADLSEQISTAGTEASGTGNMKFALNGALTVGTLDGANIEIMEEVGADNMYIFGLDADQVAFERLQPSRSPEAVRAEDPAVDGIVTALEQGRFSDGDPDLFAPIVADLMSGADPYLVLADLGPYLECQQRIGRDFLDRAAWTRRSILTVARMGKFSSDRTIGEYARGIWGVEPG